MRRLTALWLAGAVALAAAGAAPPRAAAADASLVVAALHLVEREYFRSLDPIVLLNAALAALRSRTGLGPRDVPDIGAGAAEDEAVRQFTSEFERAENATSAREPDLAYAVTRALLAAVHDSHVRFMTPDQYAEFRDNLAGRPNFEGVGVRTTFPANADGPFVMAVVPGSPAAAAGIRRFDQILAADGVLFRGGTAADVSARLRGPAGSSVVLRIRRRGQTMEIPITRAAIWAPAVEAEMIRPGVAYARVWGFSRGSAAEMRRALRALGDPQDIRSVVLDLRGNPGGLVVETEWLAGIFVPAGTVLARTHSSTTTGSFGAAGEALLPNAPLVVLVDRVTASGAEIVTIGLRDANRATVVGEKTAGAFGSARDFPLPEGGVVITTRGLTGPNDEEIEGIGITPDRIVQITVDDMLRGEDVQLNAALTLLGAAARPNRLAMAPRTAALAA